MGQGHKNLIIPGNINLKTGHNVDRVNALPGGTKGDHFKVNIKFVKICDWRNIGYKDFDEYSPTYLPYVDKKYGTLMKHEHGR